MFYAVKQCVDELKAGTYNNRINKNVPCEHRTGTITRKEFYDIFPDIREDFFRDISKEEIAEFMQAVSEIPEETNMHRLSEFTANEFYKYCALGYKANGYDYAELSPKEQYYKHADGRDYGLSDIDGDSVEEFVKWYNGVQIGHPWEVCRGGNSTHISLFVHHDAQGFYLSVAGESVSRCVEAVKIFLALRKASYPVYFNNADIIVSRFRETEKIGIVPQGVIPKYCSCYFPDEKIGDFMNLPFEERDRVAEKCVWQPLEEIRLINNNGDSENELS